MMRSALKQWFLVKSMPIPPAGSKERRYQQCITASGVDYDGEEAHLISPGHIINIMNPKGTNHDATAIMFYSETSNDSIRE
jgi:hypothetical protein